jgi:hypothetical protein
LPWKRSSGETQSMITNGRERCQRTSNHHEQPC